MTRKQRTITIGGENFLIRGNYTVNQLLRRWFTYCKRYEFITLRRWAIERGAVYKSVGVRPVRREEG